MRIIKKDWLYDINMLSIGLIVGLLSFGIGLYLFSGYIPEYGEWIQQIYEKAYIVITGMLSMYPLLVIKAICPQMGSDKVYLSTMNLPYSKKQLLFKGLKQWSILFISYSLVATLLNVLLMNSAKPFMLTYMYSFLKVVIVLLTMVFIQLQIASGIILTSAKGFKWYHVLVIALFSNAAIGSLYGWITSFVGPNYMFYWGFLSIGIYGLCSFMVFAIAYRDIENIHN